MLNKNLSERFLLLQMKSEPVFLNDLQTRNFFFVQMVIKLTKNYTRHHMILNAVLQCTMYTHCSYKMV